MTRRLLAAAALTGLTALAPTLLSAACAPRAGMVENLETKYSEKLMARGMQNEQVLIEIYSSAETGTYTVLLSNADGISCIVSSGTHFIPEEPTPLGIKS